MDKSVPSISNVRRVNLKPSFCTVLCTLLSTAQIPGEPPASSLSCSMDLAVPIAARIACQKQLPSPGTGTNRFFHASFALSWAALRVPPKTWPRFPLGNLCKISQDELCDLPCSLHFLWGGAQIEATKEISFDPPSGRRLKKPRGALVQFFIKFPLDSQSVPCPRPRALPRDHPATSSLN